MCKLWTNFAKYGNPTPDNEDRLDFIWSPIKEIESHENFHLDYLEIDNNLMQMKRNPDAKRIQFWRQMFETYNDGFLKAKL